MEADRRNKMIKTGPHPDSDLLYQSLLFYVLLTIYTYM
jgi:hypothetical protein